MKKFIKLLEKISFNGTHVRQVFDDWVTMCAITIRNRLTPHDESWEHREKVFSDIEKKYSKEQIEDFKKLFALLVIELENEPRDILGVIYEELDMGNVRLGQFFTPSPVSKLISRILCDADLIKKEIESVSFTTINDPACGSGSMLIEGVNHIRDMGYNPQQKVLVIAQDLSLIAVYMCYVQLSLLGIPAIVQHMNTLSLKVYDTLYTPFYVLNRWDDRQKAAEGIKAMEKLFGEILSNKKVVNTKEVKEQEVKGKEKEKIGECMLHSAASLQNLINQLNLF